MKEEGGGMKDAEGGRRNEEGERRKEEGGFERHHLAPPKMEGCNAEVCHQILPIGL